MRIQPMVEGEKYISRLVETRNSRKCSTIEYFLLLRYNKENGRYVTVLRKLQSAILNKVKDLKLMVNISFTPFPGLTTERLILRKITDDDIEEFHILKSDERLLKYYGAKPRTYEKSCRKLKSLNDDIAMNESITWGIALKEINTIVGSICYWNISREQAKAEIGYELMYEWQGKGIMQEAIKAIIDYGFQSMGLQVIEAVPDPENIKSVKLLEKSNFIRVEQFKEIDPSSGIASNRVLYLLKNTLIKPHS